MITISPFLHGGVSRIMAHYHDPVELQQLAFRGMLIDISRDIVDSELKNLKFYCADFIPSGRLETITTSVELWEAVREKGRLSPTDTTFLQELMEKVIARIDLLDRVIAYANGAHIQPRADLLQEFEYISENVNLRKWRHLVRTLGVTDADIDRLAEQYRSNVREQVLQALLMWSNRAGSQATRTVLLDALRNCNLQLIADRL